MQHSKFEKRLRDFNAIKISFMKIRRKERSMTG